MNINVSNKEQKLSSQYKSEFPNEVIEEQTKKIPNLVFLGLGLASILGAVSLTATNRKVLGTFVGLWVPTLLIFGLYNKLVKVEGELLRSKMH